jgi:homopolymeric O-antigen transport system ATP-binding protein
MNDVVIRAEGLGKKYLIGHQVDRERYTTLRDVLDRTVMSFVRSARDMLQGRQIVEGDEVEEFWALKDVNFEIKRGEVVGIIGRNGAGKSTLLKVLSRITEPSAGRVTIRGRVASLLEVGTGFHPELTGRENIYLNGAILGMKRAEVQSKFGKIVAFADVEKFLDTPVKRYSSGMYVRLAFAVAAHLEPDILIVDEVLAVGDADFQRKCLGKIHDVAGQGRTVLFVSHNMAAVRSLTSSTIVMKTGSVALRSSTEEAVKFYSAETNMEINTRHRESWGSGRHTAIRNVRFLNDAGESTTQYIPGTQFEIEVEVETDGTRSLSCEVLVVDQNKAKVALASLSHFEGQTLPTGGGLYRLLMSFEPVNLAAGNYSLDISTSIVNQDWDHYVEAAVTLEVPFSNPAGLPWNFNQSYGYGAVSLPFAKPTVIRRVQEAIACAK